MGGHSYTVEFRIYGESLDPNSITASLALRPCRFHKRGDTRADGKAFEPMWAYCGSEERDWDSLEEGIEYVLADLWPLRDKIAEYRKNCSTIWWCGHFQSAFDGGPLLSPELLQRLGEFGAELFVDNYFSKPENEDGEAVAKLVAARTRLTEITKQLNEAKAGAGTTVRTHYEALEKEWEEAFREFQYAVEGFSAGIKRVRNQPPE